MAVRRVKCDEAKPTCYRCTSTGRKCDGYSEHGDGTDTRVTEDKAQQPSTQLVRLSALELRPFGTPGTDRERRSLHFFCFRPVTHLSGFYGDDDFWSHWVLQAAYHDEGIRHAIVALSSIYERFEKLGRSDSSDNDDQVEFSLRQYNLAIGKLVNQPVTYNRPTADSYLASCIIFICIEILRGNFASAVSLVRNGATILNQLTADGEDQPYKQTALDSATIPYVPLDTFETLFARLELQVVGLLGHQNWEFIHKPRNIGAGTIPSSFTTLSQANKSLEHYWHLHSMISNARINNASGEPKAEKFLEMDYSDVFRRWSTAFEGFLELRGNSLTTNERKGVAVLQVQTMALWTSLNVISPGHDESDQMLWDNLGPLYQQILSLAATVLEMENIEPSTTPATQSFSLETGIVGPLYDVARQSRDPKIRRQAISLLRASSRQDGFWDRMLAADVAERVVQIEEEGLEDVRSCRDVPSQARLTQVVPKFDMQKKRATICYSRGNRANRESAEKFEDFIEW